MNWREYLELSEKTFQHNLIVMKKNKEFYMQ